MIAYRKRKATDYIIIHDSHTPPSVVSAIHWLRHNGRVLGLLDIGYHAVIDRNGGIIETRPRDAVGSHTPAYNHISVGVCLIGGLDEEGEQHDDFTVEQLTSLGALVSQLREEFGAEIPVVGHTELPRFTGRPGPRRPSLDMNRFRKEYLK